MLFYYVYSIMCICIIMTFRHYLLNLHFLLCPRKACAKEVL